MKYKTLQLVDVAEVNPGKIHLNNVNDETTVTFLPMSAVSEAGKIQSPEIRTFKDVKNGYTYFTEDDVLVAKITPCMENGKRAIAKNLVNGIGVGSTEFHVLRPYNNVLSSYLFYIISSKDFRRDAQSNMTGSAGQKRVPSSFLKSYLMPIPPLETQKIIADVLGKAQNLVDKRKTQIELLDIFLKNVFLDMFDDPLNNSNNYPKGRIRDIVGDVRYGSSKRADINNGKYPILRMNNITYQGYWDIGELKYIDLDNKELSNYLVRKGDLLFNRTNSKELVGKTAVYKNLMPMAYAGYLIRVRVNEKAVPEYIWGYLNSKHGKLVLQNLCKSIIGMANINAQELQDIEILIPPYNLQNKFAQIVEKTERQKALMQESLIEMENNFNNIMQRAFRGELF